MSVSAVSAGVLAFALSASATVRTLPTPPPSNFIDTEASTNVVFAPLQEDTRQYVVRFAGDFSPSNDLEVAIGGDTNGDGDLSPVEVETQFGIDCGVKKVKVEGVGVRWNLSSDSTGQPEQESNLLCTPTPTPTTYTYSLPARVSLEPNASSVTHGLTPSNMIRSHPHFGRRGVNPWRV